MSSSTRIQPVKRDIKRPSAYDQFNNEKRNSWLEDLQLKIHRGVEPLIEPGPSRTPSPFQEPEDVIALREAYEAEEEEAARQAAAAALEEVARVGTAEEDATVNGHGEFGAGDPSASLDFIGGAAPESQEVQPEAPFDFTFGASVNNNLPSVETAFPVPDYIIDQNQVSGSTYADPIYPPLPLQPTNAVQQETLPLPFTTTTASSSSLYPSIPNMPLPQDVSTEDFGMDGPIDPALLEELARQVAMPNEAWPNDLGEEVQFEHGERSAYQAETVSGGFEHFNEGGRYEDYVAEGGPEQGVEHDANYPYAQSDYRDDGGYPDQGQGYYDELLPENADVNDPYAGDYTRPESHHAEGSEGDIEYEDDVEERGSTMYTNEEEGEEDDEEEEGGDDADRPRPRQHDDDVDELEDSDEEGSYSENSQTATQGKRKHEAIEISDDEGDVTGPSRRLRETSDASDASSEREGDEEDSEEENAVRNDTASNRNGAPSGPRGLVRKDRAGSEAEGSDQSDDESTDRSSADDNTGDRGSSDGSDSSSRASTPDDHNVDYSDDPARSSDHVHSARTHIVRNYSSESPAAGRADEPIEIDDSSSDEGDGEDEYEGARDEENVERGEEEDEGDDDDDDEGSHPAVPDLTQDLDYDVEEQDHDEQTPPPLFPGTVLQDIDANAEQAFTPAFDSNIQVDVLENPSGDLLDDMVASAFNAILPDSVQTPGDEPALFLGTPAEEIGHVMDTIMEISGGMTRDLPMMDEPVLDSHVGEIPLEDDRMTVDTVAEESIDASTETVLPIDNTPDELHVSEVGGQTAMINQPDAEIMHHTKHVSDALHSAVTESTHPTISMPTAEEEQDQLVAMAGEDNRAGATDDVGMDAQTDMVDQPDAEIVHHTRHSTDALHSAVTETTLPTMAMPTAEEEEELLVAMAGEDSRAGVPEVSGPTEAEIQAITYHRQESEPVDLQDVNMDEVVDPNHGTNDPIASTAPTLEDLPDPAAAPPDTTLIVPLEAGDMHVPSRADRSPSMQVEPPADPRPANIDSHPPSREDTPVELPDYRVPPPDSVIPLPLDRHDMVLDESTPTPSVVAQAPTHAPVGGGEVTPVEGHDDRIPDQGVSGEGSNDAVVFLVEEAQDDTVDKSELVDDVTAEDSAPIARDFAASGTPHPVPSPFRLSLTVPDTEPPLETLASERDVELTVGTREATPYEPLRHRHGETADTNVHVVSPRRSRRSHSPIGDPPVTRSHCGYRKLRVSHNDESAIVLAPQCVFGETERMRVEDAQDVGEASREEEKAARKRPLGHDDHLLGSELEAKIHRIAGAGIYDAGHVFLLEWEGPEVQGEAETDPEPEIRLNVELDGEDASGMDEGAKVEDDEGVDADDGQGLADAAKQEDEEGIVVDDDVPAARTRSKTSVEPDIIQEQVKDDIANDGPSPEVAELTEDVPAAHTRSKTASVEPPKLESIPENEPVVTQSESVAESDGQPEEMVGDLDGDAPAANTRSKTASVEPESVALHLIGEEPGETESSTASIADQTRAESRRSMSIEQVAEERDTTPTTPASEANARPHAPRRSSRLSRSVEPIQEAAEPSDDRSAHRRSTSAVSADMLVPPGASASGSASASPVALTRARSMRRSVSVASHVDVIAEEAPTETENEDKDNVASVPKPTRKSRRSGRKSRTNNDDYRDYRPTPPLESGTPALVLEGEADDEPAIMTPSRRRGKSSAAAVPSTATRRSARKRTDEATYRPTTPEIEQDDEGSEVEPEVEVDSPSARTKRGTRAKVGSTRKTASRVMMPVVEVELKGRARSRSVSLGEEKEKEQENAKEQEQEQEQEKENENGTTTTTPMATRTRKRKYRLSTAGAGAEEEGEGEGGGETEGESQVPTSGYSTRTRGAKRRAVDGGASAESVGGGGQGGPSGPSGRSESPVTARVTRSGKKEESAEIGGSESGSGDGDGNKKGKAKGTGTGQGEGDSEGKEDKVEQPRKSRLRRFLGL